MTSGRIVALVAVALALSSFGCSTSSAVLRPDRLAPEQATAQATALTNALADKEVVVELVAQTGDQMATTGAPVLSGRVTALDEKSFRLSETSGRTYTVPFEDTRSLSAVDRGRGAREGILVGVLLGGVSGAVFGARVSRIGCDEDYSPPRCPDPTDTALPLGLVGALVGGALGAGVGALIGHRVSFTF